MKAQSTISLEKLVSDTSSTMMNSSTVPSLALTRKPTKMVTISSTDELQHKFKNLDQLPPLKLKRLKVSDKKVTRQPPGLQPELESKLPAQKLKLQKSLSLADFF